MKGKSAGLLWIHEGEIGLAYLTLQGTNITQCVYICTPNVVTKQVKSYLH